MKKVEIHEHLGLVRQTIRNWEKGSDTKKRTLAYLLTTLPVDHIIKIKAELESIERLRETL